MGAGADDAGSEGETKPRKAISDTILDFGRPVIAELGHRNIDSMKQALELIITIWNAHVMAMPAWGRPEQLEQLAAIATNGSAPALGPALAMLTQRRAELFADDPRVVSKWDVVTDEHGRARFDCTARLPASLA